MYYAIEYDDGTLRNVNMRSKEEVKDIVIDFLQNQLPEENLHEISLGDLLSCENWGLLESETPFPDPDADEE